MKHATAALVLLTASLTTTVATHAEAGSYADPVVTPAVVMEDAVATGSSQGEITLLIFGIFLLAASS